MNALSPTGTSREKLDIPPSLPRPLSSRLQAFRSRDWAAHSQPRTSALGRGAGTKRRKIEKVINEDSRRPSVGLSEPRLRVCEVVAAHAAA